MSNKCVIIFDKELVGGIQKGKLCTQAAHALTELTLLYAENKTVKYYANQGKDPELQKIIDAVWLFDKWYKNDNQIKITLQCPTTKEFEQLYENMKEKFYLCTGVIDAGLTGSHGERMWCFACIGDSEEIDEYTKNLKLL